MDEELTTGTDTDSNEDSDWIPRQTKKKRRLRCTPSSSSVHPSQKSPTNQSANIKRIGNRAQWLVTCGHKKGILHINKFTNCEPCIFSQGQWFTPKRFEHFGGKERSKNWKKSIFYNKVPLQTFIQEGVLSLPSFKQKRTEDVEEAVPGSSSDVSSVTERPKRRVSHGKPARSNGRTALADGRRARSNGRTVLADGRRARSNGRTALADGSTSHSKNTISECSTDRETSSTENLEAHVVDFMRRFRKDTLPVKCFTGTGTLHKKRFVRGSCEKCISTNLCWLTPEEFVASNLPKGNWRRDINSHNVSLGTLIKEKMLEIHAENCKCPVCKGSDVHDDECFICNSEGDLVCCDKCPRVFHHDCHIPALQDKTLGERWMCTYCVFENCPWRHGNMTEEQALNSLISQYTLHCEYLLLHIYKEDTESVFSKDPSTIVLTYRNVIREPMWLDRVREKLHNQQYETLGHFVSDIRLIFRNCQTFNKGNHVILKIGATLSKMFEQKFKIILNIQ